MPLRDKQAGMQHNDWTHQRMRCAVERLSYLFSQLGLQRNSLLQQTAVRTTTTGRVCGPLCAPPPPHANGPGHDSYF